MVEIRRGLKYAGLAVVVLVVLLVAGFLVGVLGVPTVDGVENRFAAVNESATTIDTDIAVSNPNPIGVSLGGLGIDYAIEMNDVEMAAGQKRGISIGSGQSALRFRTRMNNSKIPAWWYRHVDNGERTNVFVDVDVSHSLLGGQTASLPQEQTVETDIVGQFNDSTTRAIDADQPVVSDPVMYVNETSATYGEDLTPERTPLDMAFTVYNPKLYPYTVTEIGYTVEMNGIQVGEGSTEDPYVVSGRSEQTLEATTVIQNERLDDWWVSHLERDQVTNVTIDFSLVVDPDTGDAVGDTVEPITLDVDQLDHHTTIETDIFGTKDSDGLGASGEDYESGGSGGDGSTDGDGGEGTQTATPTESSTSSEAEPPTETATPTETPTETGTDDGPLPIDT